MPTLYIVGSRPGAGKTALAAALARRLASDGRSVSLVKPLRLLDEAGSSGTSDPDNAFFARLLPRNGAPQGAPVTPAELGDRVALARRAVDLVRSASADITIVEGLDGLGPQDGAGAASAALAQALNARVVALVQYDPSLEPGALASLRETFGEALLGVLLNNVPTYRARGVATDLVAPLQGQGVPVLGAIPEDRRMRSPTVRDAAQHLEGEFLLLEELADELVEYWMVGGFFMDQGDYVFGRRERKGVIVRADRPDLQMAALRTSTVGLLLTGGQEPIQYVTAHAERERVPLVLVQSPTLEVMERLHTLPDRVTVHNPRRVARFGELLEQHCDLAPLLSVLAPA